MIKLGDTNSVDLLIVLSVSMRIINTNMNIAEVNDIIKNYPEAINCYEHNISLSEVNQNDFINLAVLYWLGAMGEIQVSYELSLFGAKRYREVIHLGLSHYPDSLELHFWKIYCRYRLKVLEFTETECENLVKRYPEDKALVPYFFLQFFDKEKYVREINELRKLCMDKPTAKNRYLLTFLS